MLPGKEGSKLAYRMRFHAHSDEMAKNLVILRDVLKHFGVALINRQTDVEIETKYGEEGIKYAMTLDGFEGKQRQREL